MVNITDIVNNTAITGDIANKITSSVDNAILILKAIGILIIIYIIFVIIRWISDILRNRRIKKIYNKVYEMDEKLDLLLKKQGKNKKGK